MSWWVPQAEREPVEEPYHDDFREPCEECGRWPCVCAQVEHAEYQRERRYWNGDY